MDLVLQDLSRPVAGGIITRMGVSMTRASLWLAASAGGYPILSGGPTFETLFFGVTLNDGEPTIHRTELTMYANTSSYIRPRIEVPGRSENGDYIIHILSL